jgi:hypothetical protein
MFFIYIYALFYGETYFFCGAIVVAEEKTIRK